MNREEMRHKMLFDGEVNLTGPEARLLYGDPHPCRIVASVEDFELLIERVLDLRFPGIYSAHDQRFLRSCRVAP